MDFFINPIDIIEKYYPLNSLAYRVLMTHSRRVADKALAIVDRLPELAADRRFIEEAAMLHDIGIVHVKAPKIGCNGTHPYIAHGILGRAMLEKEGLPRHALVCERHTGVGITREDIRRQALPLPERDMVPLTLEEEIICYADCFFSKNPKKLTIERSVASIRKKMLRFGEDKGLIFDSWVVRFGP